MLHAFDRFIKIGTRLILTKLKVKHRNGVKLKLDFDPRKNMSTFAYLSTYISAKINSKQKYFCISSIGLVIKWVLK